MVNSVAIYTIVHQPRRLRLPAYPFPRDSSAQEVEELLFDDTLDRHYLQKVARYSYYPACDLFLSLVEQGFKLSIGFSYSFIRQVERWEKALLDKFRELVSHPNVELVCMEPYHSFSFYLDIRRFQIQMEWARKVLQDTFDKPVTVAVTTEMFISHDIFQALQELDFKAILMEGREKALGWRSPTYLYRQGSGPFLLARHKDLSDDIGYRFSQKSWGEYPLKASKYVDWIRQAGGDLVFVGWDFETFGEHQWGESGIFEFLRWFSGELQYRGVEICTISQLIEKFRDSAYELPLPLFPTTWAGLEGSPSFFFGNSIQFRLFLLMHHAYNLAILTNDPQWLDLALWLAQSDNLHLLQWHQSKDKSEEEVSSYFTPRQWWSLGPKKIIQEIEGIYQRFVDIVAAHVKV